ncbi:hypothetical protein CYCD_30820 [Tenuifilaceae bacterium CYCD]|nr:hypothetical protein CYCD_30820 [Tenuifilaceae bacterium CYCD]
MLTAVMVSGVFFSCSKDDDNDIVVKSRFTVTNDDVDGFKVNITNDSENATSYEWNFGDGSAVGTQSESTFSYSYAEAGTYTITLTAKNGNVTDVSTKEVVISGMTFKQFLSGTAAEGKVWHLDYEKLISMYNPSNTSEWWYGWNSLPTAQQRNTVRHHEYIFKPDGSFEFKTKGYTVRPGTDLFFGDAPAAEGWSDDISWTSGGGKDCSTWGNNTNLTFTIGTASHYSQCDQKITLTGQGGHIGPMDTGTETVVGEPASETFYEVLKYADGGTDPDTVILYTPWGGNENGVGTTRPGLGVITLVSYKSDDQIPADEVVVDKPLSVYDISETFEATGTMTWVADNSPAEFVEDFANPVSGGINTSAHVGKYQRGTMDYANLQFELAYRMNLSTRNVFKMKVYIDAAATVPTVSMKLQDTKQGGNAWQTQTEVKLTDQTKGQWIELTFDFSAVSTNTAYDKIVVQFGDEGTNKGDGLFYFDDLILQ